MRRPGRAKADRRAEQFAQALRPTGHTSVMAHRAPTAPDALDYFPTPPWAARAGGELVKRLDPAARSCWEPAAGEGHMAIGLADYFETIDASDVFDYGDPFGVFAKACGGLRFTRDFLADDGWSPHEPPDWIVTNPPFIAGETFARLGLERARRGVALLLRSVFLEGAGRYPLFTDPALGFALAAQFAERVPMVKGRWDPAASSATAYGWFVWLKPGIGAIQAGGELGYAIRIAQRHGLHAGLVIAPGTRERLWREADRTRFCSDDAPREGDLPWHPV